MAAPSKSFTVIPDSSVDPDSALSTTLAVSWRDNDLFLEEWLGKNFTAAVDHDHDNVNSKSVNLIGALQTSAHDISFSFPTTSGSTGALGFTPIFCLAVGWYGIPSVRISAFAGFARGTGALAKSAAWDQGGLSTDVSADADAIGGRAVGFGVTSHGEDLDVTAFSSAGITFSAPSFSSSEVVDLKVLIVGT